MKSVEQLHDLRFAKVNIDYDRARVFKEAHALYPLMQGGTGGPYGRTDLMPFTVTTEEETQAIALGRVLTWKLLALRHIEGVPESKGGRSSIRNRNPDKPWAWREDISFPYVRELVESLPFEKLHSVRFLVLPEGVTGGVHHDDPRAMFYNRIRGEVNLTLNVSSGGSNLLFWQDEQVYEISDYPAFLFRDDCWHGVERVSSMRVQLRIHARPSPAFLDLVDADIQLPMGN